MGQSKIKRKPDILKKFHKVKINTQGITDEQEHSPKFQSAYQDMLHQLTAPGFADVLCGHEAAHLFYFRQAGCAKNYRAFPASLRYDPATDDYVGSLASVQLPDIPKAATLDELQQDVIPRVAKALAAGGVVARSVMANRSVLGYRTERMPVSSLVILAARNGGEALNRAGRRSLKMQMNHP